MIVNGIEGIRRLEASLKTGCNAAGHSALERDVHRDQQTAPPARRINLCCARLERYQAADQEAGSTSADNVDSREHNC